MPAKHSSLTASCFTAWLLCVHGCATEVPSSPPPIIVPDSLTARTGFRTSTEPFVAAPRPARFSICYGGTCARRVEVNLNEEEWATVRALFVPRAGSASAERKQLQAAIAALESLVGPKTGTDLDKGGNDAGRGLPGQMDCIDESINTTVYLTMLYQDGLVQWHTVGGRATRGPFTGLMQAPHTTAVIEDQTDHQRYAVDSWFLDNGLPPFIVPLPQWMAGWRPEDKPRPAGDSS